MTSKRDKLGMFRQKSERFVSSRELVPGRQTKYSTLPSSRSREYPRTYAQYSKSAASLGKDEVIGARKFDGPEKVVNFNSSARNVTGGISASMEGILKVGSRGFFKRFNKTKNYVKVKNAKITIYEVNEEDFYGNDDVLESLLEIPFAEIRAIHYPKDGSKSFRIVFNSQTETENGIAYDPHTLIFTATTSKVIEDWLKAVCAGCINTALFLENIINYFETNSPKTRYEAANVKNKEIFLRQIVDLNTLGRGPVNQATVAAQVSLSAHLMTNGQEAEGEFWNRMAAVKEAQLEENNRDDKPEKLLSGLEAIQDFVDDSIRCGNIDLDTEYVPERRQSFVLPNRFSMRRAGANGRGGPNGRVTRVGLARVVRRNGTQTDSRTSGSRTSRTSQSSGSTEEFPDEEEAHI